jgi:hypothetical protein
VGGAFDDYIAALSTLKEANGLFAWIVAMAVEQPVRAQ